MDYGNERKAKPRARTEQNELDFHLIVMQPIFKISAILFVLDQWALMRLRRHTAWIVIKYAN